MDLPAGNELSDFANALIHSRHNVLPRRLLAPGPQGQVLQEILGAAAAAPDHGRLLPWRFVIVPETKRERLAEVFAQALVARDASASPAQIESAREKAHRAPFLMVAIVRLADPGTREGAGALRHEAAEPVVGDAERLLSLGCAIQNILLSALAAGFGTGLTSGQAMDSAPLRALFKLGRNEQAVCCINIGTVSHHKPAQARPVVADYVSELD